MKTVADVLKTIADDKSLVIFNAIALSNIGSDILISRLQLTRKQYYSRMSTLLKTGIVKREMGKYSLTTFGMILYHAQEIIGEAVNQIWKLKAIDSISVSCNGVLPQEQFLRIIDTLIANEEIKNILLEQIKEKPPIFETLNQIPVPNMDQKK
jgi:predicted transcriptional regulator